MKHAGVRNRLAFLASATVLLMSGCTSETEPADVAAPQSAVAPIGQSILDEYKSEGFTGALRDGSVLWKFLHDGDANYSDCGYSSGSCNVVEIVAPVGCSSLYVEANFESDSGTIIDYSNDTAQNLGSGDHAVLHFITFEDNVARIQLTEVNCR